MIGSPDTLFDHIRALDTPWLRKHYAAGTLAFAADRVGAEQYAELGRRIANGDIEWVHHLLEQVPGANALTAAAVDAAKPDPIARRNKALAWALPILAVLVILAMFLIKAIA